MTNADYGLYIMDQNRVLQKEFLKKSSFCFCQSSVGV